MNRKNTTAYVATSIAAALTLCAGGALARADDTTASLDASGNGHHTFMLTPTHDTEQLNFGQTETVRVCNETQRTYTRSTESVLPAQTPSESTPVELSVSMDEGSSLRLGIRQCVDLVGRELFVSPTSPLATDNALSGSVMTRNTLGAANMESMRASLADIRGMLQYDDETVLAMKVELDRTNDSFARIARELNAVGNIREASAANGEPTQR
jgi:hypothetical protein